MIDIHHHCLPEVDDGPRSWDEALEMCRIAREEGIETIVATPHVLRGLWPDIARSELESRLEELRGRLGDQPRLLLGSEYFFSHDMAEVLGGSGPVLPIAGSRYVLVEFAASSVPQGVERPFYQARLAGWTPIIAHPERNIVFQSHHELLSALVDQGARVQITAGSLTGSFGAAARLTAGAFLGLGLVHMVATDAHNPGKRPPRIRGAITELERLGGKALSRALTFDNPLAVIENRPLPFEPEPVEPGKNGFLTRLRAFFLRRRA